MTNNFKKTDNNEYKNMDPYFVTGFSDAEACFYLRISKNERYLIGWVVEISYQICLHKKDRVLLELIQTFFNGTGNITKLTKDSVQYRVTSIKDLAVIVEHFDMFPLITQKWADYQLFKQAFEIIKCKEHKTIEGLQKLVAIKASMNNDLSAALKAAFPDTIPAPRPLVMDQKVKDPN